MNIRVKVVNKISPRDYLPEGHQERVKFLGQEGVIVDKHDSHGVCYDVKFSDGMATYDPDELILV